MDLAELTPWIIDGDGHIREPDRLYDYFLPPEHRHYRPKYEYGQGTLRWAVGPHKAAWRTDRIKTRDTGGNKEPVPELRGEWEGAARLSDMHIDAISHAVLFPTEGMMFAAIEDPPVALAFSRAYNDWLGEYCAADPEHLLHVAHVPFAAPDAAAAELRRAKADYNSLAVYVRPNPYPPYPRGKFTRDPSNDVFWATAEELGVTVCFHEACLLIVPTPGMDRFGADDYVLIHAIAHPMNMMMAITEVIGTGILERHPGLKVAFLEAGCGWVPTFLQRLDGHIEDWAGGERLQRPPSEQFRSQCFTSTEGDEVGVGLYLSQYPENLVFASDYPHADCTFPGSTKALLDDSELTDVQKKDVLHRNPSRWFGIAR